MKDACTRLLTGKKIQVETALLKDAKAIAELGSQTFREVFGYLFPEEIMKVYLEQTFSCEKIYQSLQNTDNQYLLAFVERKLIGFAKLKLHSSQAIFPQTRQVQLQQLYVSHCAIGKGAGAQLMIQSIDLAKSFGFPVMWLSVLNSNYRAIRFYQRFNFKKVGEQTFKIQELTFHYDLMKLKIYD